MASNSNTENVDRSPNTKKRRVDDEDGSTKQARLDSDAGASTSSRPRERGEIAPRSENSQQTPQRGKNRDFDFSVSDFAKLVETKSFVDKTSMIRHIFSRSSIILLTVPRRFGKSTNIDMVKRFLEIEVDTKGKRKPIESTNNYRLFKDNNLEICKDKEFFDQHFGKYPVIHIDFQPLHDVRDINDMHVVFMSIITKSYYQHRYLRETGIIDPTRLKKSLAKLATALHNYFGKEVKEVKKVVVLIDNYDAFYIRALSKPNTSDTKRILLFLRRALAGLLDNNTSVKVVLTAVLPVCGNGSTLTGSYRDGHIVTEFMGEDYFSSHYFTAEFCTVDGKSTWTLFQYKHKCEVQDFDCNQEYINILEPLFKEDCIRRKLARLLTGQRMALDLSQPLSVADILKLNKILTSGTTTDVTPSVSNKLFLLLYHFSCLTIMQSLGKGRFYLNIAHNDYRHKLANVYVDTYPRHKNNHEVFDNIVPVINSIDPTKLPSLGPDISRFCELLHSLYGDFPADGQNFRDIVEDLFIIITAQPDCIKQCEYHELFYLKTPCIVLITKHRIFVCITATQALTEETYLFLKTKVCDDPVYDSMLSAYPIHYKIMIEIDFSHCKIDYHYCYFRNRGDVIQPSRISTVTKWTNAKIT